MKKGVIVVLVLLAVVVLVSPAIVGRLAEQSMDENLNWAARESGSVRVTSEKFDRGWFSSAGQHRVEIHERDLMAALTALGIDSGSDALPVLLINTRLDHGLIPVSSMSREKGSLAPGLGSALSTLQVELPGGEVVDLPGTIYSKVGLSGELLSDYVLEAGSREDGDTSASWGNTNIRVKTDPASGTVEFDGSVGSLALRDGQDGVSLANLTFNGNQAPTQYIIAAGDVAFALKDLSVRSAGNDAVGIRSMAVTGSTDVVGDKVNAAASVNMTMNQLPQFGDMSFDMDFNLTGGDAAALGRIQHTLESAGAATQDPMAMYGAVEKDLKQLFASGFDMNFERLDIALPQGTVTSTWQFSFGAEDLATFDWSSLLLSTEAAIDLSIPAALVETYGQGNQQVAAAIGGGFLIKRGDVYEVKAQLKKGLATVNGAPIPIPLGGM